MLGATGRHRPLRPFLPVLGLLIMAALVAAPGIAAGQPTTIDRVDAEDLARLPVSSLEDVANLVPGAGVLGFNEDEQIVVSAAGVPIRGAQAYAFGDDTSVPPVLDAPGTRVSDIGSFQFQYEELPWARPWPANGTTEDGVIYFTAGSGPQAGTDYTLFWAAYENPYPVDPMSGLWTNRGFVTSFEGSPAWRSSFEGDTWDGGFRMPTVQYGPDPWSFNLYQYNPPQSFEMRDFSGFGALTGNNLLLAVDNEDLLAGGIGFQDGCFGVHLHESEDGGPGYVSAWPPVPGRTCEQFADFFTEFPLVPGTLILEDLLAPPTTTTTAAPTTTTTAAPTTTTTAAPTTTTTAASTTTVAATPEPVDEEEGGGSALWWILLGLVLIAAGAAAYYWWQARSGPCAELLARWKRLQKECDEARKRLEERRARLDEARRGLLDAEAEYREQDARADALREQLAELQKASRTSVTYSGTTYHRIPEGLVTADGLQSIMDSVQDQIDNHESNMESWQESVDRWKDTVDRHEENVRQAEAEVKEKCAEAAAARKDLEDCLTPEPEPEPEPSAEGEGTGESGTPPPAGGAEGGGTAGPTGPVHGGGEPEPEPEPECREGETTEEELERKSFVVPVSSGSMSISIEPPTEEFAEWWEGQLAATGGRFAPSRLQDAGLAGTVRGYLDGLDSGMAVSHEVRIEVPRQEITYACIQHWRCSGGQWVKAHRERREVGRRRLSPIVVEETGKTDSARVAQLIGRARTQYMRLLQNDREIDSFCP